MNFFKFAIGMGALSIASQGATVALSSGLGGTNVQGITLETSADHTQLLSSTDYYVAVGRYSGGVFTPWAGTSAVVDTVNGSPSREITGSFSTSTGGAFNGLQIHVFVGLLSTVATDPAAAFTPSGQAWAVFTPNSTSQFPVSSGVTTQTVNMTAPTTLSILAVGNVGNVFNGNNAGAPSGTVTNYFLLVPEPSTMLLTALGFLGLLRRKR